MGVPCVERCTKDHVMSWILSPEIVDFSGCSATFLQEGIVAMEKEPDKTQHEHFVVQRLQHMKTKAYTPFIPECGNGVVEAPETCDCGAKDCSKSAKLEDRCCLGVAGNCQLASSHCCDGSPSEEREYITVEGVAMTA